MKPLPYEVNIDEVKNIIEALVNKPIDPKHHTLEHMIRQRQE